MRQSGDDIYLTGVGASPEGDRPLLRRMNLKTQTDGNELYRCG